MLNQRERAASGRQFGRVDVVLEEDRHAVKRASHGAASPLGITRARIGNRAGINREDRTKCGTVTIVKRDPGEVVAHNVLGAQPAGGHCFLKFGDRLLEYGEARRSFYGGSALV